MTFRRDADIIKTIVRDRDPSFRACDPAQLGSALAEMNAAATGSSSDAFLLAAMRCVALADNAHTRVIVNSAVTCHPLRIVAMGDQWWMFGDGFAAELRAVGGLVLDEIEARLAPYLSGPMARKKVIGGIMLAWPAALRKIGVSTHAGTGYTLQGPGNRDRDLVIPAVSLVNAETVFPLPEQGFGAPGVDPFAGGARHSEPVICLRFSTFLRDHDPALPQAVEAAAARVAGAADPVLVDLRGNPGGSFLDALPLIESLQKKWRGQRCAVLVDKFTFSAAICVMALLWFHLAGKVRIFGEPPGDRLRFWAEGGTVTLPDSGAAFRYSDGFHDWAQGDPEGRAQPDYARYQVAAADLRITPTGAADARKIALEWLSGN